MPTWADLSLTAQTAYIQALDAALASELARNVAHLPGSFAAKKVKGHAYWYYQYTEPSGMLRQVFVGPDGDPVRRLMARKAESSSPTALTALAKSALALGCAGIVPRHYRVLKRLADYGFFAAGGLLIGTHAFVAYANMLGVRWMGDDAARTQDIDFAHAGNSVTLALAAGAEVRTHDAITSLGMGFLPISGLSGRGAGTYLVPKEPDFRLDFLTTLRRGGTTPYEHPTLHVTLQPLKFLEYALVDVQQAALLSNNGAILVNLPHPARYALHKLMVAGERSGSFRTKSNKDVRQAALLLSALREQRPEDVLEAWDDLLARGSGWTSRIKRGLNALNRSNPELDIKQWLTMP